MPRSIPLSIRLSLGVILSIAIVGGLLLVRGKVVSSRAETGPHHLQETVTAEEFEPPLFPPASPRLLTPAEAEALMQAEHDRAVTAGTGSTLTSQQSATP